MADIHFAPTVALRVAECFDKIRVNPGNFGKSNRDVSHFSVGCIRNFVQILRTLLAADRRAQFEKLEYTEDDYQKELEHIERVENLFTLLLLL